MTARPRYNNKKKRNSAKIGNSKFKQGFYKPLNESKYKKGIDSYMNNEIYPFYRSSWKLAFYKWVDQSPIINFWGTESFSIKYISPKDGQVHRYFVDIVMQMVSGQKHLVEIKPFKQTSDPINLAKWEAARLHCEKIGAIFTVITEKELKAWGMIK